MTIERLKELAGIINEAKDELHGLYVGKKGSGKLHPQFSGSKAECHQEWKDTKKDWEKDDVHKVAPMKNNDPIDEGDDAIDNDADLINEVAPPDEEKFVKDSKADFKKRYGKRWKRVLYATAWNKHKKDANESLEVFADRINDLFEAMDELADRAGIDSLNEEEKFEIERIKYAHPPANLYQLKAVDVNDDYLEVKKELTGMDKNEAQKVKVPKSVNKAIDKRIKELEASIEKFGGGGPQETALDELKEFKRLLSSENLEDYQVAQIKYGTLWTEIEELLPTLLVNFLHTGKELENIKVQ
jgi:hypothetical protein